MRNKEREDQVGAENKGGGWGVCVEKEQERVAAAAAAWIPKRKRVIGRRKG